MGIVAFAKAKSWGLSTTVLGVGAWWSAERGPLVAELDPAGGDLAARYGLRAEPGVVSLAAAARRGLLEATVADHAQVMPGGVRALLGPASAEQAHSALRAVAGPLVAAMADSGVNVLADCGRLAPDSPVAELVESAALTVLVARPTAEEVAHLCSRVTALRCARARLGLVLVGERPYGPDEVADAVGAEVIGVLPEDPRGAALLAGRSPTPWVLRRSPLMRAARELSETISVRLVSAPAEPPPAPPARPRELTDTVLRRTQP